jgi:hypothetical protein
MKLNKAFFNFESFCGIVMIIAGLFSIEYKVANDIEISPFGLIVIFASAIYLLRIGYNRNRNTI